MQVVWSGFFLLGKKVTMQKTDFWKSHVGMDTAMWWRCQKCVIYHLPVWHTCLIHWNFILPFTPSKEAVYAKQHRSCVFAFCLNVDLFQKSIVAFLRCLQRYDADTQWCSWSPPSSLSSVCERYFSNTQIRVLRSTGSQAVPHLILMSFKLISDL